MTLQFDLRPWKTIGHLLYSTSSFVHHFVTIGELKLELQSGNAQSRSNSTIFRAVWPWNLTDDLEKLEIVDQWSTRIPPRPIGEGGNGWIAIDQSHRYGRPQAAYREPAGSYDKRERERLSLSAFLRTEDIGSYDKTTRTAICLEHKTQYLLIHAPYTRIVVFWHISNIPPMISQSQISCDTPTFYIAAIFVKYCYTTASWLL